jgi:hypothetical protein
LTLPTGCDSLTFVLQRCGGKRPAEFLKGGLESMNKKEAGII